MHGVTAEYANGQTRPSRLDVLAENTKLRGLLKWLAARECHSFHPAAGKDPFPYLVHGLVTGPVERVAQRVPAARTAQITSLKPYNDALSRTVVVDGASR